MTTTEPSRRVLLIGTGLIGTSIGLALRGQADVLVDDQDPEHLRDAVRRGAGRPWDGSERVDLAVVCAPPLAVPPLLQDLFRRDVASTFSHVSSIQAQVQAEVERLLGPLDAAAQKRVCGSHPLAGRETRGPGGATGRLFLDRPWVVCPSAATTQGAREDVRWLAERCGAVPVELAAGQHDAAVALVSHLPQVAASALAARLLRPDADGSGPAHALAGPGLQDTTRIAASEPDLWVDILSSNARQVAPLLRELVSDLTAVAEALDRLASAPQRGGTAIADADVLRDLLERGNLGRSRLPLKRRADVRALTSVLVSVPDQPGQLAGVMLSAAEAGINVEDVHVEHLPGRPRGLLELVVAQSDAPAARASLGAAGWDVLDA